MPDVPAWALVCGPAQAAGLRICTRAPDRFIDAQIVIHRPCAGVSRHLASEANHGTPDSDIVMNLGSRAVTPTPWVAAGRGSPARLAQGLGSCLHHRRWGLGGDT